MSKPLKQGDVDKLQKALSNLSSMTKALHVLADSGPVLVSFVDITGHHEKFYIDDAKPKVEIARVVTGLVKERKDAIRKKYDIDIR